MTPSEKLARVLDVVDDKAGWELAASQLQQKLIDILKEDSDPEPPATYFVAWLDSEYQVLRLRENGVLQFYARTGDNHSYSRNIVKLLNANVAASQTN